MIELKKLTVAQMRQEGQHLLEQHYEELTLHKERVKLNVNWETYQKMEDSGYLFSLGAWNEGKLIGYSVFMLTRHIHYQDLIVAMNDVLFLQKDQRKGSLGIKLIKKSEELLKGMGVHKILWHCKYGTVAGKLLRRLGYQDEEFTVGKLLGVEDEGYSFYTEKIGGLRK